jgi:hypothetical protein
MAVEGTTEDTGLDNVEWHGGRTPGGRFYTVSDDQDLIERMQVI